MGKRGRCSVEGTDTRKGGGGEEGRVVMIGLR